jgi:anti-sigma regulatory factor (Ser/Thr protein kinase)
MSEKMMKTAAQVSRWPEVMAFVDELLEENNCPFRAQMQIEISLEEMFVNIAHYAYPDGDGWAEVHVRVTDKDAEITLVDGGIPYNPLDKEDPDVTLSAEDRQVGGLGIFMVKKQMDEVRYEYRDGQNRLTLCKKF